MVTYIEHDPTKPDGSNEPNTRQAHSPSGHHCTVLDLQEARIAKAKRTIELHPDHDPMIQVPIIMSAFTWALLGSFMGFAVLGMMLVLWGG